ncbi:hypothetical protein WMY93_001159 [Mugilogobius chulae]|uniref:Uncharacterized protein n=1 Tax=Mugilogobius chulae TaxID=88201 RepID=A0AAW0Q2W0_9GOBI
MPVPGALGHYTRDHGDSLANQKREMVGVLLDAAMVAVGLVVVAWPGRGAEVGAPGANGGKPSPHRLHRHRHCLLTLGLDGVGVSRPAEQRATGLAAVGEGAVSQMSRVHRVQREVHRGILHQIQNLQMAPVALPQERETCGVTVQGSQSLFCKFKCLKFLAQAQTSPSQVPTGTQGKAASSFRPGSSSRSYTHVCSGLNPTSNPRKHRDCAMVKQCKDRDSWGECA